MGAVVRRSDSRMEHFCGQDDIGEMCSILASGHISEIPWSPSYIINAQTTSAALQDFLHATEDQVEQLLAKLRSMGLPDNFHCQDLCHAILRHEDSLGVVLPPKHNVVCMDLDCTEVLDLSAEKVAEMAQQDVEREDDAEQLAVSTGRLALDNDDSEKYRILTDELPPATDTFGYGVRCMSRQLSILFGVYGFDKQQEDEYGQDFEERPPSSTYGTWQRPSISDSSLIERIDPEFGPKIQERRHRFWTEYAAKGAALVSTAIKRAHTSEASIRKWFGYKDEVTTRNIRKFYQKMLKTLLKLRIKKGGDDCEGGTLAFVMVWSNRDSGEFIRSDMGDQGQYIVHVCEHFWNTWDDLGYRFGTLVHESAHHWGPTDVKLNNGNTAYGPRNCLKLVKEDARRTGDPLRAPNNNADNYMQSILEIAKDILHSTGSSPVDESLAAKDDCKDAKHPPFTLPGKPPTCASLGRHCNDWQHGAAIQKACPKTCGLCQEESDWEDEPEPPRPATVPHHLCNKGCNENGECSKCKWVPRDIGIRGESCGETLDELRGGFNCRDRKYSWLSAYRCWDFKCKFTEHRSGHRVTVDF